jgi:hypothetical protein
MAFGIGRRWFISELGCAAVAWLLAARAQQTIRTVFGVLNGQSSDSYAVNIGALRKVLGEGGGDVVSLS